MAIDVIMIAGFSQSFCLAVEELRARLKPAEDSTHFLTLPTLQTMETFLL